MTARSRALQFREVLVHGADRNRTLADRPSYALDRTVSDVADREPARHAGLKGQRQPIKKPPFRRQISSGDNEAPIVALENPV